MAPAFRHLHDTERTAFFSSLVELEMTEATTTLDVR